MLNFTSKPEGETPAAPHSVPMGPDGGTLLYPGFSKRQAAAIALKVPDSGSAWLDAMIREAQRDAVRREVFVTLGLEIQQGEDKGVLPHLNVRALKHANMLADAMYPEVPHVQD